MLHRAPPNINLISMKDAAAAFGVPPSRMGKVMAYRAGGEAIIVVSVASRQIDWSALAQAAGVERRKLRLASPAECVDWFGFLPAGMPPFAHRTPLRVFVDSSLCGLQGGKDQCVLYRIGDENLCMEFCENVVDTLAKLLDRGLCTSVDLTQAAEAHLRSVGGDLASLRVGSEGAQAALNAAGVVAGAGVRLMGDCMMTKIVKSLR